MRISGLFSVMMKWVSLIGLVVGWSMPAYAAAGQADTVLAKIEKRALEVEAQLSSVSYHADSKSEIKNADGTLERRIESLRQVTVGPDKQVSMDYDSMSIDGRRLDKDAMDREVKKNPPKSMPSPFEPEEMAKYVFEVSGEKTVDGIPVWDVAFKPVSPGEDLSVGRAYIEQSSGDVVWMTFSPSKLPGPMKAMQGELVFSKMDGFWLPQRFVMHLHIKIDFIFTLADKNIEVEEHYFDHRIKRHEQNSLNAKEEEAGL